MALKLEIQLSWTASIWVAAQLTDRQQRHTHKHSHTMVLPCCTNTQVWHRSLWWFLINVSVGLLFLQKVMFNCLPYAVHKEKAQSLSGFEPIVKAIQCPLLPHLTEKNISHLLSERVSQIIEPKQKCTTRSFFSKHTKHTFIECFYGSESPTQTEKFVLQL